METNLKWRPLGSDAWQAWSREGMVVPEEQAVFCQTADGYRSVWHGQTPQDDDYAYKYSGALGTYCAKHRPQVVYCAEARKTFWVYGGTSGDDHARDMSIATGRHMAQRKFFGPGQLLPSIVCVDHDTKQISAPVVLFDKWCGDPHDNPVLTVDADGFIFVFVPSHGPWTTPSFILRSRQPYDHTAFDVIETTLFAYPQPWPIKGTGLVLLHTQYDEARRWLCVASSTDGMTWAEPRRLAHIERGQYMVSTGDGEHLYGAFNMHPLAVWASGDCRQPGPGFLHFADTDGNVHNLPHELTEQRPWYPLAGFR